MVGVCRNNILFQNQIVSNGIKQESVRSNQEFMTLECLLFFLSAFLLKRIHVFLCSPLHFNLPGTSEVKVLTFIRNVYVRSEIKLIKKKWNSLFFTFSLAVEFQLRLKRNVCLKWKKINTDMEIHICCNIFTFLHSLISIGFLLSHLSLSRDTQTDWLDPLAGSQCVWRWSTHATLQVHL